MQHDRMTHYKDEDIHFEGEVVDYSYFLHLNVDRYSHNVQKKIDVLFKDFAKASVERGWPEQFFCYIENKAFAEYMGGTFIQDITISGKTLGVYVWAPQSLIS